MEKFESASRSCHYRACPDNLDPRIKSEDDKGLVESIITTNDNIKGRQHNIMPRLFSVNLIHTLTVIHGFIPSIYSKQTLPLDSRVKPEYDGEQSLIKGLDVVCQCAALLERRVQSSTRVRKAQAVTRQTNPIGRSMIEMLGVLAIIGVLSVGGIAGYTKAMREYRSNQQKQQLSQVFSTVISLKNSIGDYPQTFDNITYILDALNEIRDGFSYKIQRLHDDYGNIILLRHGLQTWTNEDGSSGSAYYYLLTLQFSGNGFLFSPDGEDFCRNALLTVQAFRNDIKSINLLITTQSSKGSDSKPLGGKNLDEAISSPVKIQQTCQFCKSSTSFCNLNIVINK